MIDAPRTLVEQQLLSRAERLHRLVALRAPLIIIESATQHVLRTVTEAMLENERRLDQDEALNKSMPNSDSMKRFDLQ